MGQPYLSIAAKDNLQKPWAFGVLVIREKGADASEEDKQAE